MMRIYLSHPLGGDVVANLERAELWLTWARRVFCGCTVEAPWIDEVRAHTDPVAADADADIREAGLVSAETEVVRYDALLLCGIVLASLMSEGMRREYRAFASSRLDAVVFVCEGNTMPPATSQIPLWLDAVVFACEGNTMPPATSQGMLLSGGNDA